MFLQSILEKRKLKKMFSKYVDKDIVNAILNNPKVLSNEKIEAKCGYLVADIMQDDDFDNILSKFVTLAEENNLVVYTIFGSLIYLNTFTIMKNENSDEIYKFIQIINVELRNKSRGIFGVTTAKIGNYGAGKSFTYFPLINNFTHIVCGINNLNYGEYVKNEEN